METIHISEIKRLLERMLIDLETVLHAIETKVLIGEINRPESPVEKKPRKRRTKKDMYALDILFAPPDTDKGIGDLPEDKSPFYVKPKRVYQKKVKSDHPIDI